MCELARRVGINNGTLSVLERGITEPTISTIANIAKELQVDLETLVQLNSLATPLPRGVKFPECPQTPLVPSDIQRYIRNPRTWPYVRAVGKYLAGPPTEARSGRLLYDVARWTRADIDETKRKNV